LGWRSYSTRDKQRILIRLESSHMLYEADFKPLLDI
jgi:hypothetical protein